MKGRKKLTAILSSAALACLLLAAVLLSGCGPEKPSAPVTYGDIYVSRPEVRSRSSGGEPLLVLGKGVSVPYTENKPLIGSGDKDYSSSYFKDGDLLLCAKEDETPKKYGVWMLGENPVRLMGDGMEYRKISIKHGFVLCAKPDNSLQLFDLSGRPLALPSSGDTGRILSSYDGTLDPDRFLVPIGGDFLALRSVKNFYRILKRNGDALEDVPGPDGSPLEIETSFYGRDKNVRFGLSAADDYVLKSVYGGSTVLVLKDVYVHDTLNRSPVYRAFGHYGEYDADMVRAVFYMGDGKLYCCQKLKTDGDESHNCTITDDKGKKENFRIFSWLRDLRTGEERKMGSKVFFLSVFNSYNASGAPFDVNGMIRKGYTYVSLGYRIEEDGTAVPEQYVLGPDLHVYVSMISREGTATRYGDAGDDYRDVLLSFNEGVGCSPDSSGDIIIYDASGWTILRIPGTFSGTRVNNGVITATGTYGEGEDAAKYRAAFNLDGTPLFDAESRRYTELSSFVDGYALAKNADSSAVLLDSRGEEHSVPFLHTGKKSSKIVFMDGVYFSERRDDSDRLRVGLRASRPDETAPSLVPERYFKTVLVEGRDGLLYCLALTEEKDGVWEIWRLA